LFGIKKSVFALISVLVCSILMAGCGGGQQSGTRATQVKAMNVLQQDTPLTHVYAGQIVGTDEVNIQSRVSGNIVEKYVQGGQLVTAGQPLYRIDDRPYRSAGPPAMTARGP